MTPEIPNKFVDQFIAVRDINLAAVLLSDDKVERLNVNGMRRYIEGTNTEKPLYYFHFKPSKKASAIFAEWKKVAAANGKGGFSAVAVAYRAFETADIFTRIIRRGVTQPKPRNVDASTIWTVNTKVAATALALAADYILPSERLERLVYRDGDECGYLLRDQTTVNAFAAPDEYVQSNPNSSLAYAVAAFYQREALRDLVNMVPAQHIFRKPETNEVYLVVDPKKNRKEIPVHA